MANLNQAMHRANKLLAKADTLLEQQGKKAVSFRHSQIHLNVQLALQLMKGK